MKSVPCFLAYLIYQTQELELELEKLKIRIWIDPNVFPLPRAVVYAENNIKFPKLRTNWKICWIGFGQEVEGRSPFWGSVGYSLEVRQSSLHL